MFNLEVVEFFRVVVLGSVAVRVSRSLGEPEEVVVGGAVEAQHVLRGAGHAAEAHHLQDKFCNMEWKTGLGKCPLFS